MTVKWEVVAAREFAKHAHSWDALNDACARSPLLHSDLVAAALHHFGSGRERLALGTRAGRPVCAALFTRPHFPAVVNSFQPSQAPVALWVEERDAIVLAENAALTALARDLGPTTMMVGISQIDPEMIARPSQNASLTTLDAYDTARVTVTGTFDAYWAARGKNLRANMKKMRNRLDAEGVEPRFDCITDPALVADAIADYGRLESASWKASGGTAVSHDNAQGRFYRDLFERFCARAAGRIHRCFYGDRLAAMDLCVSHGGVLVILKTSFDETIKGTSPAFLMRHDYFPAIFETRAFERIEFYGRVMDWHTKWTDEVRTLYHVTAYRWPFVAKLDAMRRAKTQRPAERAPAVPEPADA